MKYFDFEAALNRRLEATVNDEERWAARTIVGKEEFAPAAIRAGLKMLHRGDRFAPPSNTASVVIGVATWSDPDVAVLDSAVDRIRARNIPTWVFDIDECQSISELQSFLPQMDMRPTKTPVFAFYVEGHLQTCGQGSDAVHWLEQL